mgnify:CR=1 FL=1
MSESLCPSCGGSLAPAARPGRTSRYGQLVAMLLPPNLLLPTCTTCRTFIVPSADAALAAELRELYRSELGRRAAELLDLLHERFALSRLERAVGLSQAYLSNVRNLRSCPSPALVSHLFALARAPQLIAETEDFWASPSTVDVRW